MATAALALTSTTPLPTVVLLKVVLLLRLANVSIVSSVNVMVYLSTTAVLTASEYVVSETGTSYTIASV